MDKTEDQEAAQIEAEKTVAQAGAEAGKRRGNVDKEADKETTRTKAGKKNVTADVKEKITDAKEKLL